MMQFTLACSWYVSPLPPYVSMYGWMYVCMCIYNVCMCAYIIHTYVYNLSACLSFTDLPAIDLSISVCLSVCLSVCHEQSACLSLSFLSVTDLFACLSISLSVIRLSFFPCWVCLPVSVCL